LDGGHGILANIGWGVLLDRSILDRGRFGIRMRAAKRYEKTLDLYLRYRKLSRWCRSRSRESHSPPYPMLDSAYLLIATNNLRFRNNISVPLMATAHANASAPMHRL